MDWADVYQVSELTLTIKKILEAGHLADIAVEGEISNFTHHSSGHMYFTLKDAKSRIRCVMFRSSAARLTFTPQNGQTVVALGSVGVYLTSGEYQLYVEAMVSQGIGALHALFAQTKAKLEREGLFDPARKREIPALPQTVAVITSPTGAAVRDIISVMQRRYPPTNILLIPALVQGPDAVPSLLRGLELADQQPDVDTIIIGRGGGSLEELWAFNDEALARAVAAAAKPIISAVGHETDFTIADFAADLRAPTPSAAAEMAVPDYFGLTQMVAKLKSRCMLSCRQMLQRQRSVFSGLAGRRVLKQPGQMLAQRSQRVDELEMRLGRSCQQQLRAVRSRLAERAAALNSLSPLAVLARGYAVVQNEAGQVVRASDDVAGGDSLEIILSQGRLYCIVEEGEKNGRTGAAPRKAEL